MLILWNWGSLNFSLNSTCKLLVAVSVVAPYPMTPRGDFSPPVIVFIPVQTPRGFTTVPLGP